MCDGTIHGILCICLCFSLREDCPVEEMMVETGRGKVVVGFTTQPEFSP